MKLKLLLSIFAIVTIKVVGQPTNPYLFSHQIDSILNADSNNYKYQISSVNYSFIGDYKRGLETKELQFKGRTMSKPTTEQIAFFSNYKEIDAGEYILQEASKTKILIINEAHHVSRHRVFLTELLKDLKRLGYDFIGFEALAYEDSVINERGYPILSSGFYTREPCFGNLIRESINNGFYIFPYEQHFDDSIQNIYGREKSQALNIKRQIDEHPNSKFVIYCGYDHIVEDTLKNSMGLPMAGQLKKLTGIDPFTVDQTALIEYFSFGNKYRQLIKSDRYSLFVDSTNFYFNKASFPKSIDCNLYQPTTEYINGRPNWLISSNKRSIFIQNKIEIRFPCLIQVYLDTDDLKNAVPIDIVEIESKNEQKSLVLNKGRKHIVLVRNKYGEEQLIRIK